MKKVKLKEYLTSETEGDLAAMMGALEDGALLGKLGASQEDAEELHAELQVTASFPFPFPSVQPEIFGRQYNGEFGVHVLNIEDGSPVTRIPGATTVYPIGAFLSADWEHAEGIVLSMEDAKRLGIEIE